ncbi:hypothetical protein DY000_02037302 [Brassica cretica]|uniref:Uncharacterized protein n=1 Tax=Brassica cretica TaxID=69181 RepID=A0ABQ7BAL2_BRACR|nr:hypothetical protein DY000_02037302 [Brassica cretica]
MASMVIAPPPSKSRPPPDPPPRTFPPLGSLSPIEPLEPPDPPDSPGASLVLALPCFIFVSPIRSSQAPTETLDLELLVHFWANQPRDVSVTLVYSSFIYCSMQSVSSPACRVVPLGPCPDSPRLLSLSILQVCSSSSKLYGFSFIKWYRELVERIALDLWILAFNCNVPIDLISLGSFMLFSSTYVILMRPFTALRSPVTIFNPVVVGACFLCSPWWQVKGKLTVMYPPVNMSMSGIYFPAVSYLEQCVFPICPHMLSDLDEKASLLVL